MKDVESKIPERSAALAAEKKIEAEREKTLRTYKTERAKTIAAASRPPVTFNRRFVTLPITSLSFAWGHTTEYRERRHRCP